ncbi:MAG: carboxypeptidase regulatory-like domain-containing protein [Desulfococcaceae bacterium]|jgi:hypothetical protein|nr:carboxypeptidase regulatory-like domain-containing protein [Desulfococcaceae bacterium]
MKKQLLFLPFVLFTVLLIAGCKLSITAFTAPETAETGEIITLAFSGQAVDEGDNTGEYGIVLQIPENWEVKYSKATVNTLIPRSYNITEETAYLSLYTPEPGYKIWIGTTSLPGTGSYPVEAKIKIVTASFEGNTGSVKNFSIKVLAGAFRTGGWVTDDPQGVFSFAAVTNDKYTESVSVSKMIDRTAPAQVPLSYTDANSGTDIRLNWAAYDEERQKDVLEYRIYQSSTPFTDVSGMTFESQDFSELKQYDVTGLTEGSTWYFAVSAVDEAGNENKMLNPLMVTPQRRTGTVTGRAYYQSLFCFPGLSCDTYGIEGATVRFKNYFFSDISKTAISDADGYYTVSDLPIGRYSVGVEKEGYQTANYSVEVLENETVNVHDNPLTLKSHTVSGYIKDANNTGIEAVSLKDASGTLWAVTDVSGNYSFPVSQGTNLNITPLRGGYSFSPSPFTSENITSDIEQNFTATANTLSSGDADGNRNVDLKDLILVLKVLSGDTVSGISADADVDNDQIIGLPEALYILQKVAGQR